MFFRCAFALLVLVGWLGWRGEFPRALYTRWFGGHLLRSVSGAASMFLVFAAYSFLPLADVTAVGYAGPLIIVVPAAILLKERIGPARALGVTLGFSGVLLMLWEHLGSDDPASTRGAIGAFCALAGAFFVAIAMIQTRRLVQSEHMGAVVFYFQSISGLIGILLMTLGAAWPAQAPFATEMAQQAWRTPDLSHLIALVGSGLFGGLGQILMTRSYTLADASVIACFDYTSMIFVLILSLTFLGEQPSPTVLAGASIVAAAGIMVILSERRRRRRPS